MASQKKSSVTKSKIKPTSIKKSGKSSRVVKAKSRNGNVSLTSIGFAVERKHLSRIDAAAKKAGKTRSTFMREVILQKVA